MWESSLSNSTRKQIFMLEIQILYCQVYIFGPQVVIRPNINYTAFTGPKYIHVDDIRTLNTNICRYTW